MGNGPCKKVPLTCLYSLKLSINRVWAIQDLNL